MWTNNSKDNELIAKFMGAKYVDEHLIEFENFHSFNEINEGEFVYTNWFDPETELQYHTSWDWLMPVVEKIMDISFNEGDAEDFYSIRDCIPDINHTYKAVLHFIKNLNK